MFHVEPANINERNVLDTKKEKLIDRDSFPIPVCDNILISRSRIYQGEGWRGKIASKHRYFYGIKGNLRV